MYVNIYMDDSCSEKAVYADFTHTTFLFFLDNSRSPSYVIHNRHIRSLQ